MKFSLHRLGSTSTGNRQIGSHCKELLQIEHGQLLLDDTIKYNLTNEIVYNGSLVFICQFGLRNSIFIFSVNQVYFLL